MTKSQHIYNGMEIPYEELNNFIEPINATISVPLIESYALFHNPIPNEIKAYYKEIIALLPTYKSKCRYGFENLSLTYTPHSDGYDFRIHPLDIIKGVYKTFNINIDMPFINLDDSYSFGYFIDFIRAKIEGILDSDINDDINNVSTELLSNLNTICNYYSVDLSPIMEQNVLPKDALFYLAYRSLILFEETSDDRYLLYAKEYYDHVSHMITSFYPHYIDIGGRKNMWFRHYRDEYESVFPKGKIINANDYLLANRGVCVGFNILPSGKADNVLKDEVHRVREYGNVDYQKYRELFLRKMGYYLSSGYMQLIEGTYSAIGYVGFVYPNEYLVFDKFHNREDIDPSKRTILTHPESIYAFPSDRLSLIKSNKQELKMLKVVDSRIRKINHTDTFVERLDKIVKGNNVSTSRFEEEVKKLSHDVLVKRF